MGFTHIIEILRLLDGLVWDLHVRELVGHDQPVVANESPPGGPNSLLAVGSEWNVRDTGMLPAQ